MPSTIDQDQIETVARIWRNSRHPIAFTGAGISVPSGIPDFRSPGGLWSRYNPLQVATLQALRSNPTLVWEFLLDAVLVFKDARPNPAHTALAELERARRLQAIITQNIDSLHQDAGSSEVVEYHGTCRHYYCPSCRTEYPYEQALELTRADIPWTCACGGVIRPDLVLFGEGIPARAQQRCVELIQSADLVCIVGTSGEVAPANLIPHQIKARGGVVVEINLGRTSYGPLTDHRFDAPAEEVLPRLAEAILA